MDRHASIKQGSFVTAAQIVEAEAGVLLAGMIFKLASNRDGGSCPCKVETGGAREHQGIGRQLNER